MCLVLAPENPAPPHAHPAPPPFSFFFFFLFFWSATGTFIREICLDEIIKKKVKFLFLLIQIRFQRNSERVRAVL